MTSPVPVLIQRLPLLFGLVVLSSTASHAQTTETNDIPVDAFEDAIAVEVVNVDVVVVDKKGRPVTDLSIEDFELNVDGRPATITHFANARGTQGASEVPETMPAAQVAGEGPRPIPEAEVSHFVIFVDNLFLQPGGRGRVLERLPTFVDAQLASGARIMIVAQDFATTVVAPFSTDADELYTAIDEIAASAPSGLHHARDWPRFTDEVGNLIENCPGARRQTTGRGPGCTLCQDELVLAGQIFAQQATDRRRNSIAGLQDVVSALSGIPGRKALLYVSDGFAEQPGFDAFFYLADVCPENQIPFQQRQRDQPGPQIMHTLTAHANANRVTLFTLEAGGLRTHESSSVTFASSRVRPSTQVGMVRRANTQGALFYVAEQTGGKAILNANDPSLDLEKVNEELDSYYSLGFQPDHAADGEVHNVGVRLVSKRAGYDVRYRRSFLHKPTRDEMGERTLGALLFGMEKNPLGARATIERSSPVAPEGFRVPITIDIPRDRLVTLPQESLERGRLTVILAAELEREGTTIRKQELNIARPLDDQHDGNVYRFGVEIDLPAGEHLLGIGLWDRVAQEASFLRVPVTITDDSEARRKGDGAP